MFCRHGLVFSDLGRCKRLSKSEGWTRSNQVFLRVHIPRQFFACCLGFPDSVGVDVYWCGLKVDQVEFKDTLGWKKMSRDRNLQLGPDEEEAVSISAGLKLRHSNLNQS
jgi:hypothetical protein